MQGADNDSHSPLCIILEKTVSYIAIGMQMFIRYRSRTCKSNFEAGNNDVMIYPRNVGYINRFCDNQEGLAR